MADSIRVVWMLVSILLLSTVAASKLSYHCHSSHSGVLQECRNETSP